MFRILRLEQWIKNLVIFLPAIFANKFSLIYQENLIFVFLGFSIVASSTYIFNDLKDLDQDKLHPTKKFRPIAKGDISIRTAKQYGTFLFFLGFVIVFLSNDFAVFYLIIYSVLTVLYSQYFKYMKYFDFLSITILFGVRLFLGSYITGIVLTNALSLFTLSTINQIILAKKISIRNNPKIDAQLKVKRILINNYSNLEINLLFMVSLATSLIILFIWTVQWFNVGILNAFLALINFLSISLFNYRLFSDTFNSKTEDFISWTKSSKMIYLIIISGLLVMTLLY